MGKKMFVPSALIFLLLFLIIFSWNTYYLIKKDTDQLLTYTDRLEASIINDEWQEATEIYNDTKNIWTDMLDYWPMLIHHQEMDSIEESFVKLQSYLLYQENSHALAELLTLVQLIHHLPQKEVLILKNIF